MTNFCFLIFWDEGQPTEFAVRILLQYSQIVNTTKSEPGKSMIWIMSQNELSNPGSETANFLRLSSVRTEIVFLSYGLYPDQPSEMDQLKLLSALTQLHGRLGPKIRLVVCQFGNPMSEYLSGGLKHLGIEVVAEENFETASRRELAG